MAQGNQHPGLQPNQPDHDFFPCRVHNDVQGTLANLCELRKTTPTPPTTEMPWKGNEFSHAEDRDRLHPNPRGHTSRLRAISDSGSSGVTSVTFRKIENMPARGILSHASFERSRSESKVGRPNKIRPSSTTTRQAEPPVTADSIRVQLHDAVTPCRLNDKDTTDFIPLDKQSEIVTPAMTREMLRNTTEPSGRKYTESEAQRIVHGVFQEWPSTALSSRDSAIGSPGAGWMATRRRRLFIILILISNIDRISLFIDNDIDDLALPIEFSYDGSKRLHYKSGRDWSGEEPPDFARRLSACFEGLGRDKIDLFKTNQQRVHVPFFQFSTRDDMQIYHFNLDAECVLPFTTVGERRKGGNAIVQKVTLDPSSYNYEAFRGRHDGPEPVFALKKLTHQGEKPFRDEVEIFERLAHRKWPKSPDHLLRLELAFMHGEQGYLMFPWADGSLKDYWKEASRDPADPDDIIWFFEQCFGLAVGLRRLHHPQSYERSQSSGLGLRPKNATESRSNEPDDAEQIVESLLRLAINASAAEGNNEDEKFGRHTDVKPDNILWYRRYAEEDNHLVISDFGSAQFNSQDTRSNVSPGVAGQKGTTYTYQAPELTFGSRVTRRYDIWSLGCVFLEFAVWFHQGGWQAVENFAKQRVNDRKKAEGRDWYSEDMFYLVKANGTARGDSCDRIKPSVEDRIRAIRSLHSCKKATIEFLDLIEKGMLALNAEDRLDGDRIRERLRQICSTCRKDVYSHTELGGYDEDFRGDNVSPGAGHFDGTSPETDAREFSRDAERTLESELQDTPTDQPHEVNCNNAAGAGLGRNRRRIGSEDEFVFTSSTARPVTPARIERGSTASTSFISQTSSLLPTARQNTTQLTTPERVGSRQDVCEDSHDVSFKKVVGILKPEPPVDSPERLDQADDKPATQSHPGAAPPPQRMFAPEPMPRDTPVDNWMKRMKRIKHRATKWTNKLSRKPNC